MKPVVFAGPSLFGITRSELAHVELRPPAVRGDVLRALNDGARVIGIIDGVFGSGPTVQHKEILYALSTGAVLYGAASMGALRAAECDSFGMIGIGSIYRSYRSGERNADADVAVTHAPAEFGYQPLSEALVDVEATVAAMTRQELIDMRQAEVILTSAREMHFTVRTWPALLDQSMLPANERGLISEALAEFHIEAKRADAVALIQALKRAPEARSQFNLSSATLNHTLFLAELIASLRSPRQ